MKNRIIIGLIIIGVFIPILYLSVQAFQFLAYFIVVLVTREILSIKAYRNYSLLSKACVYLVNLIPIILIPNIVELNIVYVAIIVLIYFSLMVFDKNINFEDLSFLFTLSLYVIIGALSALYLRNQEQGFYIMLFVVFVTAASDSGAYFIGSSIGKHKLIPRISPKKTVEGALGGLVFALMIGFIYYSFLPTGLNTVLQLIIVSLVLGVFAQMGDLYFSSIKRTYKIKDFSNTLKEHGGILDRLDSQLTNFIVYVIILTLVL